MPYLTTLTLANQESMGNDNRQIAHLDLDTFFVSVERLLDSRLNDKPVLVGGLGSRGVVSTCSYEARQHGIYSGMSMKIAQRMCPQAIAIKGDAGKYSKFSNLISDIIKENVPAYEMTSMDEFFIDMTGMDRAFGSLKYVSELRQKIMKESGLPISMGFAGNKTVSKVATGEAKPCGQIQIIKGTEKPFLAPLPVERIPGVGTKTSLQLKQMGIVHIKTLQDMPIEAMERVMGKNGTTLWKRASGIDNSPLTLYHERKSIATQYAFPKDTADVTLLKNTLIGFAEGLAYSLRDGNKLTSCVNVKITYSDRQTYTKQRRIPYTALDHSLIRHVLEVFENLYERRVLVRQIGVEYSGLVGGGYQMNLLEDSGELVKLYQAMDYLRSKHKGNRTVYKACSMNLSVMNIGKRLTGKPNMIPAHRNNYI